MLEKIKQYASLVVAVIVAIAIGYGIGYYNAPDKTKTETKTDQTKTVNHEEDTTVTKKYDPTTGKVIEETTTKGKKDTTVTDKSSDKTKVTEKTRKTWAVKGGVAVDPRDNMKMVPRVGAEMRLPIFDSWVGVEGDINVSHPLLGAYLRVEF